MIELLKKFLKHIHSGKVRDTFALKMKYDGDDLLLVLASDRVSVFDFILGVLIPGKGELLTAMNIFWRLKFPNFNHDLVAFGANIDAYLPPELRNNPELQKRAIIVRKLKMIPIEFVFRDYLTGSGWKDYQATAPKHMLCGHPLPAELHDGSKLPERLFTPSTKAKVGHDENITAARVNKRFSTQPALLAEQFYGQAVEYSLTKGIIIPDTKLELGYFQDGSDRLGIGDEVITPDSSRFWDFDEYGRAKAKKQTPPSMDKQFLRDYAKTLGINKKDPKLEADREWVRKQKFPDEILLGSSERYHVAQTRLTTKRLTAFQGDVMGIQSVKE